jgi:hypothetical protein
MTNTRWIQSKCRAAASDINQNLRVLLLLLISSATISCSGPDPGTPRNPVSEVLQNNDTSPELSSAVTAPTNAVRSILVDLPAATFDGINFRQDIHAFDAMVASGRARRSTEELEGSPNDFYIIPFGTHELYRHWNALSFKDPIFRTETGVGIGSTVGEFEKLFGKGRFAETEGPGIAIDFASGGANHFTVSCDCSTDGPETYKSGRVLEIWIW